MAMQKKRIKSNAKLVPIADWETADQLLRRVGRLQNEVALHELACAEQIDAAKRTMQDATAPLHEKIDQYVKSLEAYCAANRQAFGKQQSKKLQFGKLGFRRSVAITVKKTTLELIKFVFGVSYPDYVNVKETPDKTALADLPDEKLALIDARREDKETFFVEPDRIESVDNQSPRC